MNKENSEFAIKKEREGKFYQAIGNNIKCNRKRLNITQDELASSLNISRVSMTNIETGKQRLPVHLISFVCYYLKCQIDQIVPLYIPENINIEGEAQPSPLPESVEETKWQLCPKCNGTGEMYINELYKNQTTGRVGCITCDVCGGAKILASPYDHSAEVEKLREALKGIGNSAVYMINHEHQTVINSGLINHILETVNLALSQDALKEK